MVQSIKFLYANIGKLITSSLNQNEILRGIMTEIEIFFNPSNWSLLRLDENSQELFFLLAKGISFQDIRNVRLKLGEGIAGNVALKGESLYIADVAQHPDFSRKVDTLTGFQTKSIIAVPIRFQDRILGVIEILNKKSGSFFNEDEHVILQTIADFAAIAFANAQMYQQSMTLAQTDMLTGVYNRNYLNQILDGWAQLAEERRRDAHPYIVLVLIDLNDFKDINDSRGHMAGDDVLRDLAHQLKSIVRKFDFVFRIGGDEFLILMPTKSEERGNVVAQQIRERLHKLLEYASRGDVPYSFSYGIKVGVTHQYHELFAEADKNMYYYKKR